MKKKSNLLYIDGKAYSFNMEQIERFLNYSEKVTVKETEILDSFESGIATGKTVRELTTPGNPQIDSIRYDMVKTLIVQIITFEENIGDINELPFGMKIAVNTMIRFGFLEEITE